MKYILYDKTEYEDNNCILVFKDLIEEDDDVCLRFMVANCTDEVIQVWVDDLRVDFDLEDKHRRHIGDILPSDCGYAKLSFDDWNTLYYYDISFRLQLVSSKTKTLLSETPHYGYHIDFDDAIITATRNIKGRSFLGSSENSFTNETFSPVDFDIVDNGQLNIRFTRPVFHEGTLTLMFTAQNDYAQKLCLFAHNLKVNDTPVGDEYHLIGVFKEKASAFGMIPLPHAQDEIMNIHEITLAIEVTDAECNTLFESPYIRITPDFTSLKATAGFRDDD